MKPAFEIARAGEGTAVVVLNQPGAALVHATLVEIKGKGVKFGPADRGLLVKLGKDKPNIVLDLSDDAANRLCDVFEEGLDAGLRLHPMVYALGEKLAHRIEPGCFFGRSAA